MTKDGKRPNRKAKKRPRPKDPNRWEADFRAIEASKRRNAGKSFIPHQHVMREFGLTPGRKKRKG